MFTSPSILWHYIKFDIRTIITLEKLLGAWSFGGFIDRLARHQATILVFSSKFGFLSTVWFVVFSFLGCN
jgi:hypothetical protein